MLGFILIVVLTWQIYKTANDSGRNGVLWGVGTFIGSFVLQFAIGIGCGVLYGLGMAIWGWSQEGLTQLTWPVSIIAIIVNVLAIWIVFRYLSKIPESDSFTTPPPPPTFNQ